MVSLLYGWTREYTLWSLTIPQLNRYYENGIEYDMARVGGTIRKGGKRVTPEVGGKQFRGLAGLSRDELLDEKEKLVEWKKQFGYGSGGVRNG